MVYGKYNELYSIHGIYKPTFTSRLGAPADHPAVVDHLIARGFHGRGAEVGNGPRQETLLVQKILVAKKPWPWFGFVWKCCVPRKTQWFCWSLSLLNGYFIGKINPTFSDKPIFRWETEDGLLLSRKKAKKAMENHMFLMGKSTIIIMFNSYVKLPEGNLELICKLSWFLICMISWGCKTEGEKLWINEMNQEKCWFIIN